MPRNLFQSASIFITPEVKFMVEGKKILISGPYANFTINLNEYQVQLSYNVQSRKLKVDVWFANKKQIAQMKSKLHEIQHLSNYAASGPIQKAKHIKMVKKR